MERCYFEVTLFSIEAAFFGSATVSVKEQWVLKSLVIDHFPKANLQACPDFALTCRAEF